MKTKCRRSAFAVLAIVCCIAAGCAPPARNPDGTPVELEDNLVGAVREAQAVVERMLKNPAGAKWPGLFTGVDLRTHASKNSDGTYTIKSYVDAPTPLGVTKRVWYLATATGKGNRWTISNVQLNE